jgi:hypothetical protein
MKLKKLILMGGLVALFTHTHTHTHTQAQQPNWGLHNTVVNYSQNQTTPLPSIPNPEYTQNAVWDPSGNISIYEADGVIYDKNGGVILDMTAEAQAPSFYDANFGILSGFTEFIFVPVPESCSEYYGITTYSNGVVFNNYISDVVWCKIDLNQNGGLGAAIVLPQTGLLVAKESISCATRGTETENKLDFQMHIEISKVKNDGNRYLFASNSSCVSVLDVNNGGISFIDGYQTGNAFKSNLRSEMEVYQNDDTYEVAMHYYGVLNNYPNRMLSIFSFDMSGGTPSISHYYVSVTGKPSQERFIKGLEFSENGLYLYATITTVLSVTQNVIAGDNIIYFERSSLNNSFAYGGGFGGILTSGASTMDFGLGMIEKGKDGKLWIVGNNRLATLADFDNPLSALTVNAMSINNNLTTAMGYNHDSNGNPPSPMDVIYRKMYLMIDQIDGEDYSSWTFGNNLYPSTISSCAFPFNLAIPLNTVVNFFPPPVGMYGGGFVNILQPGTLELIYNQGTECETIEIIKIIEDDGRYCPADFEYEFGYSETTANAVIVTSECGEQIDVLHSYYLYELDSQGNWVYIDNCGSPSCALSIITPGNQFKVTHIVQNLNSICHSIETMDVFFNF